MVIHQYYKEMKGKDVLFTRLSDPLNRAFKDDVWKNRTKVSDFVRKQTELILKGNQYFCVTEYLSIQKELFASHISR